MHPLLGLLNFTHFVSTAGYAAIFALCVLQSCCVPTSSELTMGLAGALAAQGKLSLAGVIVAGAGGEVVGAYVAWVIGRYAGRAVVDRFGRYVLLSHRDLDRAEAWYARHQRFGVFGSRLLPVIRNFVALPAGIAEVPLVRFGLLTAAGSLIWDGGWAGIGYGVGARWHTIAKGFGDIGYVLGALLAVAVVYAAYHRFRSYKEATEGDDEGPAGPGRPRTGPGPGPRGGPGAGGPGPLGRGAPALEAQATTGAVRWVASSSGKPPERGALLTVGTERPVASRAELTRRARRRDFPDSPVAAWEAAVMHRERSREDRAATGTVERALLDGTATGEGGPGVEANGRLTSMLGALLLVLLAIEGVTIVRIHALLAPHVLVGMVMLPVVLLKIGSATWRFARYYLGSPEYRRKGPPPPLLRLLGPFIVVVSLAVIGTGIALLLVPHPDHLHNELLLLHKVTFVLWFAAMTLHVLGHLLDVATVAPRDFYRRTRRQVRGAGLRQWAIVISVCLGILAAVVIAPKVAPWRTDSFGQHKPSAHSVGTTARLRHSP